MLDLYSAFSRFSVSAGMPRCVASVLIASCSGKSFTWLSSLYISLYWAERGTTENARTRIRNIAVRTVLTRVIGMLLSNTPRHVADPPGSRMLIRQHDCDSG